MRFDLPEQLLEINWFYQMRREAGAMTPPDVLLAAKPAQSDATHLTALPEFLHDFVP